MCQVNGEGSFFILFIYLFSVPWSSETLEPIHLKFGMLDLQSDPTCKIWWPPLMEGGVGIWVKLYPACFSFIFFGSFNASTTHPKKRGFRSMHPKMSFGGGCVPLGSV